MESIAGIPHADDPNVHMILEGVRKSLDEAQKKALHLYRADTAERHGILDRMRSLWKEVTVLQERMSETLARALETASRVNGYVDEYARVRNDDRAAARALSYSASKTFAVALFVVCVVVGCGFVSFQLIVAPLVTLMPARHPARRLAGEALGGADRARARRARRLRDGRGRRHRAAAAARGARRPAPAPAALRGDRRPVRAGRDRGRARRREQGHGVAEQLLGFVLPFVVALAAVPLDTLLDSGRHAGVALAAWLVSGAGSLAFLLARAAARARERAAERLRRVRERAAPHRALARAAAAHGRRDAAAREVERVVANTV